MARPLTNDELQWYENNIARAIGTVNRLKILAEIEEDPDILEMILDSIAMQERLRVDLIEKMKQLRSERRETT